VNIALQLHHTDVKGFAIQNVKEFALLVSLSRVCCAAKAMPCAWLLYQLQRRYGLAGPDAATMQQLVKLFAPTGGFFFMASLVHCCMDSSAVTGLLLATCSVLCC
jgi:hypothetical protein